MRYWHARSSRHSDRAGNARNHRNRNTRPKAGLHFLTAPAKNEWVPALEPDHEAARRRVRDEQLVDFLLRHRPPVGDLPRVDDLNVWGQFREDLTRAEPVGDHHVRLREQLAAADRDQPRVAWPAADKRDAGLALAMVPRDDRPRS
jgi:hypothetical protein